MANQGGGLHQRGPSGWKHAGRKSGTDGLIGHVSQDGPGGQKRGHEGSIVRY